MTKEIRLKTDEIVPSLALLNSVINSKNALPILGDVRFETKADNNGGSFLELMASDSETWLQVKVPCYDAEVGIVFCVDAKSILQALRNLSGKQVTITVDSEKHTLRCVYDTGDFSLAYEDASDYPFANAGDGDKTEKRIDAAKLLTAIEKAGFAVANDELRPIINGVHFDFLATMMVSVATDCHKLAKYSDMTIQGDMTPSGFTLPKKPCGILMNILASTISGDVKLVYNSGFVVVNNTQFKLSTRLIDGNYPKYDSVIPKDNDVVVHVDRAGFVSALKRVIPMGNSSSELVKISVSGTGIMVVSAEDYDFSKSAKEQLVVDNESHKDISIGFKGSALLSILQSIDGNSVKMMLKNETVAGVFAPWETSESTEYVSLLTPMLINQ